MNKISPDWIQLIEKYLCGNATEEERNAVDAWYRAFDEQPGLTENMNEEEVESARNKSLRKLQKRMD